MEIAVCKSHVADGICDDNGTGMQLLGHVFNTHPRDSELQLHQVCMVLGREAARRHRMWRREFADSHGDLVAGVAPGTVYAVFLHLVG
jgi:hypothetical protein